MRGELARSKMLLACTPAYKSLAKISALETFEKSGHVQALGDDFKVQALLVQRGLQDKNPGSNISCDLEILKSKFLYSVHCPFQGTPRLFCTSCRVHRSGVKLQS